MVIEFHVCDMSLLTVVHVVWMPGQKGPVQTPVLSTGMSANTCVQQQSQSSSCLICSSALQPLRSQLSHIPWLSQQIIGFSPQKGNKFYFHTGPKLAAFISKLIMSMHPAKCSFHLRHVTLKPWTQKSEHKENVPQVHVPGGSLPCIIAHL